jgi:outer membrane protein
VTNLAPAVFCCIADYDMSEPMRNDWSGVRWFKSAGWGTVCLIIGLIEFWLAAAPRLSAASTNAQTILSRPLSLAEAVDIALQRNPSILRSKKNIETTQGVILQTRAIAIPRVRLTGNYSALEDSDVDKPTMTIPGFSFGTDQSWATQIKVVQSIYEGGRMASAFRVSKLSREQSLLNYQTAIADTILNVQTVYYDVQLNARQISVQEASLELLNRELADTSRRFEAGTVPRFNVLRAEVEVANARPKLIRAKNAFRISKNNLVNLLGFDLPESASEDIPLDLTDRLEAVPYSVDLVHSLTIARERRTELESLRKAQALRHEDVINARAGYRPSLQAFAGYDAHSSLFGPDLTEEVHGWIAGVQLSWDIFDGQRTRGKIKETTALYERAGIELEDAVRGIELDVRKAFSSFVEARELLESQAKVVEQGEEALRLATARSQAGSGTQLDVLSAQTALTEARTTQIEALHDYSVSRARLERAIGINLPSQTRQP